MGFYAKSYVGGLCLSSRMARSSLANPRDSLQFLLVLVAKHDVLCDSMQNARYADFASHREWRAMISPIRVILCNSYLF